MKKLDWNGIKRLAGATLTTVVLLMMGESALAASTSANAIIENAVVVNYENLGGTAQTAVTAEASVTILLVEVVPDVAYISSDPTDLSAISEGQTVTFDYQVTSATNGPDNYDLIITETLDATNYTIASTFTDPTDVGVLGATVAGTVASLTDATCIGVGAATPCSIIVPTDILADTSVNGIETGDRVKVVAASTLYCTVDSITDNGTPGIVYTPGTPANESIIAVDNCTSDYLGVVVTTGTVAVSVGDAIQEATTVTVSITTSTGNPLAADGTTLPSADGSIDGGAAAGASVDAATITIVAANLQIRKFVRNVTATNIGTVGTPGDVLDLDSVLYYAAGVDASPTDTLEYAIVMVNQGGGVQNVTASDSLPPFTTYVVTTGAALTDGIVLYTQGTLTSNDCDTSGDTCEVVTPVVAGDSNTNETLATATDHGGDAGTGTTLTIYGGVGANEAAAGDKGGAIAAGEISIVTYRVTVN